MKLQETFGFTRVSGRHRKIGQQPREGRPSKEGFKKRPNKNLWFQDDKLWTADLDLTLGNGNYTLVTDENEEQIIASDHNKQIAFGFWDKKKNRGITFKKPRPIHIVTNPKATLREFLRKNS